MRKRPSKYDPSKTGVLRRRFEREMRRRFNTLKKEIVLQFDTPEDVTPQLLVTNARWDFPSSADALSRFKAWLLLRMSDLILEKTEDPGPDGTWLGKFVTTAFFKGAEQSETAFNTSRGGVLGGIVKGVSSFLRGPVNLDKVELLKARAYEQLEGITNDMSLKLGNVLADGITKGDSPRSVARTMVKEISGIEKKRARTLARTETIRAHAEGSLEAMKQLGVTEVGVDVEWTTTKHLDGTFESRVCPKCRALEGMIIPIDKASGLLPRHPNCRCAWVPSFDEMESKTRRERIRKSVAAGLPRKKKRSFEDQVKQESWPGADLV